MGVTLLLTEVRKTYRETKKYSLYYIVCALPRQSFSQNIPFSKEFVFLFHLN